MKHSLYAELLTNGAFQNIYLFKYRRYNFFQCMQVQVVWVKLDVCGECEGLVSTTHTEGEGVVGSRVGVGCVELVGSGLQVKYPQSRAPDECYCSNLWMGWWWG